MALLLIDVINDLDFPRGHLLLRHALPAAKKIARLSARARHAGVPVIYVNDNFGRWKSDFRELIRHCREDGVRGLPLAELLSPEPDDYFVLKPKHSGFFASCLDLLLKHLGARSLILAGFAADICVLYTANDAFMRDYRLLVPRDCVASETPSACARALRHMRTQLHARIGVSSRIAFPDGKGIRRKRPARAG
jgi:nicotinamidase-related amidase